MGRRSNGQIFWKWADQLQPIANGLVFSSRQPESDRRQPFGNVYNPFNMPQTQKIARIVKPKPTVRIVVSNRFGKMGRPIGPVQIEIASPQRPFHIEPTVV
jgi:hypothetical protein